MAALKGGEDAHPMPVLSSKRGTVGESWWGHRFIDWMEKRGDQGRLSRGKTCARNNRVKWIEINPGFVEAQVIGSRVYRVKVGFIPFTDDEWSKICSVLASEASYIARLCAGEVPEELDEILNKEGVSLIPNPDPGVRNNCTCPDWGDPCKHTAAVFYILAEYIDRDPFMLFMLKGKRKEEVIADIRRIRAEQAKPRRRGKVKKTGSDMENAQTLLHYYTPGDDLSKIPFLIPEQPTDGSILLELGQCPCNLGGRNLGERVRELYPVAANVALSYLTSFPNIGYNEP